MIPYLRAMRPVAIALSLLVAPAPLLAQAVPSASPLALPQPDYLQPENPWLYEGSDIPRDPDWKFGELPNGLRYAVRNNLVPPGQVSIRIRIDAGSLYETDSERGFAHLLEHLTFRQSTHIPAGQAIAMWQRLGATFGSDTNAETSPTHTVYKLDLPEASTAKLEESFKLLSGMIREPTLSDENLRDDLPIVLAEMRDGGGAARRVGDAQRQIYFAGQKLAERSPIGTLETLQGATAPAVKAFHSRWYRPENVVISMAGDASPERMAELIERYFGDWQVAGPPAAQPDFGTPQAPQGGEGNAPVGEVRVLVEPDLPRRLTYVIRRPWTQVVDTIEFNRKRLIGTIALQIIARRLEARARAGGSYLFAGVERDDVSRSSNATYVTLAPLDGDWQAALQDVRAVIADALAEPPTEEEIAREVAEFEVIFVNLAEQHELQTSSNLADEIMGAVDVRETVADPQTILEIYRGMRDRFTPEAVFEQTRQVFQGVVTNGLLVVSDESEGTGEQFRAALEAPVEADGSSRIAAQEIRFEDLPPIGEPGAITVSGQLGVMGIEALEFENGVRAAVWRTPNEPGRVNIQVRFGDGYQAFKPEDAPYIALGEAALVSTGFGELGQEELDRLATGRLINYQFGISEGSFVMTSHTRPADVADQLYMLAAKLAMPRWDAAPVLRAKAGAKIGYDSWSTGPGAVLSRDLGWLLHDRDPRFKTATPEELDRVTAGGFRKVWEPILASGPVEVMVFGDIDTEEVKAQLARTFGALAPRSQVQSATMTGFPGVPRGQAEPVTLHHRGDPDQAAAAIAWPTGGGVEGLPESRQIEILGQVFSNRILDAMREKAGASYSPQVGTDWPKDVDNGGRILALAQVPPDAIPVFFAEADRIARDLIANGPNEDELQRVTEPMRQMIDRGTSGNYFWMIELSGALFDSQRIDKLRSLRSDFSVTTPQRMQELAAKYLSPANAYRIAVLPQGQQLAGQGGAAPVGR